MAKNKLLATEPAGDAALLNGQPVKEKHESIWKDVFAGIVSNKASLVSGIFILILAAIAIVTKPTTRTRRTSANRCWGPRRSTGSAPTSRAATSSAACSWARRSR